MQQNFLLWFTPLIPIAILAVLERIKFNKKLYTNNRDRVILSIEILSIPASLVIALFVMYPLVNLLAPLQLISVAGLQMPRILNIALSFLLIDLAYYWIHRLHHLVPYLWRLHRLHHADEEVDALTTVLHHPFEIISGFVILTTIFVVFDIPVIVITYYSMIFIVHSAITHTRLLMPVQIDRLVRLIIVTPNMHRKHHAKDKTLGNTNFGQLFSFWDRLFGTYSAESTYYGNEHPFGINANEGLNVFSLKQACLNPFK